LDPTIAEFISDIAIATPPSLLGELEERWQQPEKGIFIFYC
jgi:hypothetical protein